MLVCAMCLRDKEKQKQKEREKEKTDSEYDRGEKRQVRAREMVCEKWARA